MVQKMVRNILTALMITFNSYVHEIFCSNCITEVGRQDFTRYAEFDNYVFNITDTCLFNGSETVGEFNVCMLQCHKDRNCAALLHDQLSGKCQRLISPLTIKERLLPRNGSTYLFKGILENVALLKSTSMSSLHQSASLRGGHFAVDGLLSFVSYNFAHTSGENSPWLKIDLGQIHIIQRVVVFNRGDSSGNRLHDLIIKTGPSSDSFPVVCGTFKGPGKTGQKIEIVCSVGSINTGGRFVLLRIEGKPGETNYLTLNEVEVFATIRRLCSG